MSNISHNEYQDIIESCAHLTNGWAVINVTDEFILEHCNSRNDVIATLMEYIQKIYPLYDYSIEWERILDTGYFADLNIQFENTPLQFLYSYLVFLDDNRFDCKNFKNEMKRLYKSYGRTEEISGNSIVDNVSFESSLPTDVLEKIFFFLVENKCIAAATPKRNFVSIFGNNSILKENRILWIMQVNSLPYHPLLFELLNQVVESGFTPSRKIVPSLYKRIVNCFVKPSFEEFTVNNLKQAFKEYNSLSSAGDPLSTFSIKMKAIIDNHQ